jgi:peptidoglycan/LPS O-acetylase OafA/YrhL
LISIPYYKPDLKVSNAFIYVFLISGRNIFSIGVTFIMLSSLYPVGAGKAINKFLSLKIWYPLAQLSYSIYLFHLLIGGILYYLMINLFGNITNPDIIEIFGAAILVIILTFLFSIFAYAGIERPFMNLRKNFYS